MPVCRVEGVGQIFFYCDGMVIGYRGGNEAPRGRVPPRSEHGGSCCGKLFSIAGSKTRSRRNGDAHLEPTREEDGHWIVPSEVEFSTMNDADSRSSAS